MTNSREEAHTAEWKLQMQLRAVFPGMRIDSTGVSVVQCTQRTLSTRLNKMILKINLKKAEIAGGPAALKTCSRPITFDK